MSATRAERRWLWAVRMTAAAAVWSLGLLVAALLIPAYDGETTIQGVATLTRQTLVQNAGAWALAVVAVPVIAAGVVATALAQRRLQDARWAVPTARSAVGVLAVVALLTITSVGAFMVPAGVLLVLAIRLAPGWGDVRTRPVADS